MSGRLSLLKRSFDIVASSTILLVLSPVLATVAAWVKAQDGGRALYRGARVGYRGKEFQIFKFRTMVENAEKVGSVTSTADDPRILPGGHFVRRWKLDELPQFLNILRGDMTFIGPRPEMPKAAAHYTADMRELLNVRPGLVDYGILWNRDQGERLRGSADPYADYMKYCFPVKARLSREYARSQSLTVDIKIAAATLGSVVLGIDPTWCIPKDMLNRVIEEAACESSS